jgi:hypothetical protein
MLIGLIKQRMCLFQALGPQVRVDPEGVRGLGLGNRGSLSRLQSIVFRDRGGTRGRPRHG